MSKLLTDLLAAGLIEKLEGDDERFVKMEKAAVTLAQEFQENPKFLIRAILAGLDPDISADDPAILLAEKALLTEWKSMGSVYTNTPVGLLRAILLDSCTQVSEGESASILWLTAADTLPLMRLGKEESAVLEFLKEIAEQTEELAITISPPPPKRRKLKLETADLSEAGSVKLRKVDREKLKLRIGAAAGPEHRSVAGTNPNPHWSNQPQDWSWEFTDRMSVLLADELDAVATYSGKQVESSQAKYLTAINEALNSQRLWVQNMAASSEDNQKTEQTRLNALWWSEALYSPSLRCSYRELPSELASLVMAVDLIGVIAKPTPASVGYLLAETVNRLPNTSFERDLSIYDYLNALREARSKIPEAWLNALITPPDEGRFSLRDLFLYTLGATEWNIDSAIKRAGLENDMDVSIPDISHAMFRQEQAVQLAEKSK